MSIVVGIAKVHADGNNIGTVDEFSLEQIHESTNLYTLIVRKTGALGIMLPSLMTSRQMGRQAGRL